MTKRDLDAYLSKLVSLRSRITGEVQHLTDEAFSAHNGDSRQPQHVAELGTDAHEQEITIQMLQSEETVLGEVNSAIQRVSEGTYGVCERCSKAIPKPRLNAIPYTRYCVSCQQVMEEEG